MKHAAMMPSYPALGNAMHISNIYSGDCTMKSATAETVREDVLQLQAQLDRLVAPCEGGDYQQISKYYGKRKPSVEMIRGISKARLDRNSYFLPKIFADPAWDILLDLYAAELAQVRVSISSLCIASNVPSTTALRWINALEAEGLIERNPDPLDGRRFFISLTQSAIHSFAEYFADPARTAVI